MTSTDAASPAAKQKSTTRIYKVLQKLEDGETEDPRNPLFQLVGDFTAASDKAAMKLAASELKKNDPDAPRPTLVAVAESNWNERAPHVETKEVVSWV